MPATDSDVTEAVIHVLAACEPDAADKRVMLIKRMVASRGYSAAELAYAARELPFDEVLNDKMRFNRPIMPADFERVIKDLRTKRAKLKSRMPLEEAEKLCVEFPDEIEFSRFRVCGFDRFDKPLVRYAPDLDPVTPEPNPRIDDEDRPQPGDRIGDTTHISEVVE